MLLLGWTVGNNVPKLTVVGLHWKAEQLNTRLQCRCCLTLSYTLTMNLELEQLHTLPDNLPQVACSTRHMARAILSVFAYTELVKSPPPFPPTLTSSHLSAKKTMCTLASGSNHLSNNFQRHFQSMQCSSRDSWHTPLLHPDSTWAMLSCLA